MNRIRRTWTSAQTLLSTSTLGIAVLLLAALSLGCVAPPPAIAYASVRSGCDRKQIEVVKHDGHDLVLNVCGVHENWKWHAFNGWEYAGPSATQPVPTTPQPPVLMDQDGDGVPDTADACPTVAGVASLDPTKNGCPAPVDSDGDGFTDDKDACPQQAGIANADPAKNGCPPVDSDGDGFVDETDACPQIPGIKTDDPATNGCPGDTDGDSFRDDKDGCPKEPGEANENPELNGCPKGAIVVTETQVIINDRIEFAIGQAIIRRKSLPLVDKIAKVLTDNPRILKIEIQGHTDNTGSAALNTRLSDRRAKAVMKALTERGIDAGRMIAKGYGPDKPIATNDTPEGKQQNRRVQFNILEQTPKVETTQLPPGVAPPAVAPEPKVVPATPAPPAGG